MDEWPVQSGRFSRTGPVVVNQPKTTEERCHLASRFAQEYDLQQIDMLIDAPESGDPFERTYAPWPLRFFLVSPENKLLFVGNPLVNQI
jgi:hypothetical protein